MANWLGTRVNVLQILDDIENENTCCFDDYFYIKNA